MTPWGFPRHKAPVRKPLAPLRRVTGPDFITTPGGVTIPRSRLECGHLLHPASDIYGSRHPERRRCWKCRRGDPPDVTTEDTACSQGP